MVNCVRFGVAEHLTKPRVLYSTSIFGYVMLDLAANFCTSLLEHHHFSVSFHSVDNIPKEHVEKYITSYDLYEYSRVSVIRLSVVSPTRLYVQLLYAHPEYFTWRYTEDYFHLYVPLSSTSKLLSPDLDV